MKANRKWLKAVLALGVRNFGPSSVASELIEFSVFDNFFPDLAEFQDLDVFSPFDFSDLNNFSLFDFPNFLACSTPFPPIPNLLTSSSPSFFPEASLLLSLLLEADLLSLFLLKAGLSSNPVVFSVKVSRAAILLKR